MEQTLGMLYNTINSTKQFVWLGDAMAEERDANNNVTKRFFAQGEQINGTAYFFSRDHLGSVREMTDSSGNIQARYDYDPYGRTTLVQGTNLSDFQYAGMYEHQPSGLNLTLFRAYDPNTARWLSRDPLGEGSDATLYSYVGNNPASFIDILGLSVTINYSDGTSITANTAQGFVNAVNNSGPASIDSIIASGHGDAFHQNFHPDDDSTDDGLVYDFKTIHVEDEHDNILADLGKLLKGKFDPNGSNLLYLQGCDVASGDDNIAKNASKILPGTKVVGSPGPSVGLPYMFPK